MKPNPQTPRILTKAGLALAAVLVSGLLHAAPGGGGNSSPAPPVPYVNSLTYLTRGTTQNLTILGQATSNEAFVNRRGNTSIAGSFSNPGITINSITVVSATSLTLNVTVSSNAAFSTSTLTITNPDGQSATSSAAVACVTDVPVINSVAVTPVSASVIDNIEVTVTSLTNIESTSPVTFEYLWHEDGAPTAYTQKLLPASATKDGSTYVCQVTPVKGGNIRGSAAFTQPVAVSADVDQNGLHDSWESSVLSGVGADPNADEDGDGLSTLAEYLFGLNPNDANSNRPIVKNLDPATGEFEYSRAAVKLNGVTYKVWTSPDLVNWTEQTGASQAVSQANANSEVVKVGLSPSLISANSKLFVRVTAQ